MLKVEPVTRQVGNLLIQYDRCTDETGKSFTSGAKVQVTQPTTQGPVKQGDDDDSDTTAKRVSG